MTDSIISRRSGSRAEGGGAHAGRSIVGSSDKSLSEATTSPGAKKADIQPTDPEDISKKISEAQSKEFVGGDIADNSTVEGTWSVNAQFTKPVAFGYRAITIQLDKSTATEDKKCK